MRTFKKQNEKDKHGTEDKKAYFNVEGVLKETEK